jgi:shikimate kinase
MKPLFLTGFMGAGKTTVGKELSKLLALPFVDLDHYIERSHGVTIKDMFATIGEEKFRELESEALKKITTPNLVIATGGGIILNKLNRDWMKREGVTIHLHVPFEQLVQRLSNDETRPLINNNSIEQVKKLFEDRLTLYYENDLTITAYDKSPKLIATEIVNHLTKGDGS